MAFSLISSVSFFFIFFSLVNPSISSRISSFIELPITTSHESSVASYCEGWRLAVETNNAGSWSTVPYQCVDSLKIYLNGVQYNKDYDVVASYAIAFAKSVEMGQDGKDAWVFDIDETLLSNLEYYAAHGYGSEPYNSKKFNKWVVQGTAPAFDASLRLYNALKKLGFTIVLLTGRDENQRSITEKNLRDVGYSGWDRLLLRGSKDQGKAATVYKSEQRANLINEGFKIHGSTGDQWSDLEGFAVADRSFKVPNPIYFIP